MAYLIEFRFHGKAKYEIKNLVHEINQTFGLKFKRVIPHITLVGPINTNNEKRLIRDFNRLCSKNRLMNFEITGFDTFVDNKVVFLDVKPSTELDNFRWELAQTLKTYCDLGPFDNKRNFAFHSTLAMKLSENDFRRIDDYVNNTPKLKFKHVMVRATLLKNGLILREYDFLFRRPLTRELAKDMNIYSQTMNLLNAYFEKRYDPNEYISGSIKVPPISKRSVLDLFKELFRKKKTFIASDLHLDHENIINYCKRPFLSAYDMNKTLIWNWNNTIRNKDTVYFLGDLAYGGGSKSTDYWLKQLNGRIVFIKGNHDESHQIKFYDNYILKYGKYTFFLTHVPGNVPNYWKDWVIYGHHHNNNIYKYPHIDRTNKRINVSIEFTKYKPIDINELIRKIETNM